MRTAVPASCTPVGQPMDAGIIAKIKGKLRALYGAWVVSLTQEQIAKGTPPSEIKVPADVPTCKMNLTPNFGVVEGRGCVC